MLNLVWQCFIKLFLKSRILYLVMFFEDLPFKLIDLDMSFHFQLSTMHAVQVRSNVEPIFFLP